MVTHAGQILDTTAPDQNNGVFLQVMADTGNISRDLDLVVRRTLATFAELNSVFGVVVLATMQVPRFVAGQHVNVFNVFIESAKRQIDYQLLKPVPLTNWLNVSINTPPSV